MKLSKFYKIAIKSSNNTMLFMLYNIYYRNILSIVGNEKRSRLNWLLMHLFMYSNIIEIKKNLAAF